MFVSQQSVLAAVIGSALAFAPVSSARDAVEPPKDMRTDAQKIEDLQKEVKRLTEMIQGRKDESGFPIPNSGLLEKVRTLEDKVAVLETQLKDVKNSTSLRPGVVAPALKGTVRVVNEYPVMVTILINNATHRVEPGKSLDVEVPAGDFNYQLLQSGAQPVKSTIKDKEVVTLRIK